jgi:hypothetical protein
VVVAEGCKVQIAFDFFDGILGHPPVQSCAINLDLLDLPTLQLTSLGERFTEAEIWAVIRSLLSDKAPGTDGFTSRFLQTVWPIIRGDIIDVFHALWHRDF